MNKAIVSIILLLFCFYSFRIAEGQDYYSDRITTNEGLPDDAIRSVFKDSRGYYWIGTEAGVSKWDGETFVTYNTLDGLAGNNVWDIDEDKKGNLWFACYGGGISCYNGKKFISYTTKGGLPDNFIRKIKWDRYRNCLLIGTSKSISVFKDSTFYNFTVQNGELWKKVIITSILPDSNKAIFIDFSHQNLIMTLNKDSVPVISALNISWINDYSISSLNVFENGDTVIGWGREGIAIKSGDVIKKFDSIGQVFDVAGDNLDNWWIASWNGGGISPPGGLFKLKNDDVVSLNNACNIKSILGWEMYYDTAQQLIFYGTLDEGLYEIPPPVFEYYKPQYFEEENLDITDLEIDHKNRLWFNTDSTLFVWDQNTYEKYDLDFFFEIREKREKLLSSDIHLDKRLKELEYNYKNKQSFLKNIEFDSKKNTWVAASFLGFYKVQNLDLQKAKNIPRGIVNFNFDENDTLFCAGQWSVYLRKYLDFEKSNDFICIKDSVHLFYPRKMIQYKNETWLCSRYEGLFMYKDGLLRVLGDEDTTINKLVSDVCFDKEGYAYLGGRDGRVEILKPGSREKYFEFKLEYLNQSVEWVNISGDNLYVGYNTKMLVISLDELKNKRIVNKYLFGKSDAYIPGDVISSRIDKYGNIWLATDHGLVKINTGNIKFKQLKPLKTIIRKTELFNKTTDWGKYSNTDPWSNLPEEPVKLHHTQNHLSIYYHTLNFKDTENEAYFYMLEGADKKWQSPSNKNYVVYPSLNPGKYIFRVKSLNRHSNLFSKEAKFSFTILTPWYNQWWFIVIISFLGIGLIIFGFYLRLNHVKKTEKRKREVMSQITELETKALQAQMNPHFIFNSINSIQNYILDNDVDDALIYLNYFSKIIRMTLDFLNKKFISLSDEINYLRYYAHLENMRFDELFDLKIDLDIEIDPETTIILPMLLQPIIENSIKHGIIPLHNKKGHILIKIEKLSEDKFRCIIEDNGIGRKAAKKQKEKQHKKRESKGLKITEDRLKTLESHISNEKSLVIEDLYKENGTARGTKVVLVLPVIL